jgi:hypothetical protein
MYLKRIPYPGIDRINREAKDEERRINRELNAHLNALLSGGICPIDESKRSALTAALRASVIPQRPRPSGDREPRFSEHDDATRTRNSPPRTSPGHAYPR